MNQNPLEPRIASALGNPNIGSAELSELISEVEGAAASAAELAAREHDTALDLTASSDIAAAEQAVAHARLSRDRLQAVLPKLRERLSAALNSEQHDRWLEDYKRVKAKLDEAADMFAEYPELAARLVEIFRTARTVDREISRLNGFAPDGEHRRIREVELEARGLDGFTRDTPSIAKTVQLADWEHSAKMAWPTAQWSFAVELATSMTFTHPGGDWWQQREERAQAMREESARVAAFYEKMAREREERENAEAASVAAARRSRA